MDRADVLKLFLIMNNAYPNFAVDETKIAMWQEFLNGYPFEKAKANLLEHIRTSRFQPTPAEIMKPDRDPEHFTDYGRLKSETDQRLQLMDEWQSKAVLRLEAGTGE